MASRTPLSLHAYRFATAAASPLVPLLLKMRLRRGKEDRERLPERRGETRMARPDGPLVWLHGASVGELNAVMPLIERLREREVFVLVTSGTVTSAAVAAHRLPEGAIHQFVPVDVPKFVDRFLDHWQPDLALFVESDLWPNLIAASAARDIPLIVVNGRLSERSFVRWRRFPRTIGALLRRFDLCLAQSIDDSARFSELGAPRVVTTGNLKLDVPAPLADPGKLAELKAKSAGRPIIAAASTHPGEETAMIDVHRRLRHTFPGLLTIVVPRHPERGPGIAEIVRVAGLKPALRSAGELPQPDTDVYVADTLGELGLIYRLASVVFIGGSLINHGGQNPIEAAKLKAAIVHGPHVGNFAEIYSTLDAAGGATCVADHGKLAICIGAWLRDEKSRIEVGKRAQRAMEPLSGALDRTLAALDPYMMQSRLEWRMSHA